MWGAPERRSKGLPWGLLWSSQGSHLLPQLQGQIGPGEGLLNASQQHHLCSVLTELAPYQADRGRDCSELQEEESQ